MSDLNIIKDDAVVEDKEPKKSGSKSRYFIYIGIVLLATGLALFFSLYQDFNGVVNALTSSKWQWILIIIGVVALSYVIDALVITIFMRLYTRHYHLHQGLATSMIGAFYSGITPSASGGQIMQVYTLKKQGAEVSNAASIFVMYFILYQVALILFGLVTIIFKWNLLSQIGSFTINFDNWSITLSLIPLTILGFLLNILVIGLLFLMSYSHKFHNFIMHYGISFLAKIRILKHPDNTRESLRIQVENFKIELRRLQSNIPVTILIVVLLFGLLICRFSIPWFAGMALDGYGYIVGQSGEIIHTTGSASFSSFWDACFISSYHQMITGLIPLPGSAGVSELFFAKLFANFYTTGSVMSAAQIIWRSSTFYLVLLVSGLVSAFYKASPKEHSLQANRSTFVTLQFETYEERKRSSDTLYETRQISRKELQSRLKNVLIPKNKKDTIPSYAVEDDELEIGTKTNFDLNNAEFNKLEEPPKKKHSLFKKKKNEYVGDSEWRDFDIRDDD